ncbi:hypothetical protein A2215_00765 [Candidatus Berkelbacteria bacterium RIFOXYA2_FULL_43_10]|uniref:Fibronectin type-III domain-containing protein n=1 Tax=Candidatus Berkelbacteria bacterium RIFOXYA2_FULL_43_10 TaxID=1797472 RepID=A0A1F5E5J4_9BACT|nr:MAG: hypothetical protein A2215_00765 [Candidatus Berkelbacteria bacterium RIFOXYA2_FULL_43_10]
MNKTSGVVIGDYLATGRMQVGGGATWYLTANSTPYPDPNTNGNTGWTASGSGNLRTISAAGGNWSSTAAWNEGAVPTAADDVIALGSSGNLTIDATAVAKSINMSLYPAGRTLTHNSAITLSVGNASGGELNFTGSWTYTKVNATASALSFVSTSNNGGNGWNITWGGHTPGNITFNGVGGKWKYQDGYTNTSQVLTLTAGELDVNAQTISFGAFTPANSANAILTLTGNSNLTVATTWGITGTAWILNSGTSTITFTANGVTFYTGGKTYYSLILTGSGNISLYSLYGGVSFTNLTRNTTAVKTDGLNLQADPTITGTLTLQGNSTTNRLLVYSSTLGTARTLTAAAVDIDNVDFMDITGAGAAAPFTGVSIGDAGGNSQITPDVAATQTWDGSTGNWSTAGSWTSRVPLPQDDVVLAGTNIVTADMPRIGKSISFSAAARLTLGNSVTSYGSLSFTNAGVFTPSTYTWNLGGRTAGLTIASAGKSFYYLYINAPNGTYTLADAVTANYQINVTAGNFITAGYSVNAVYDFYSIGSITRSVDITNSTVTIVNSNSLNHGWRMVDSGLTLTTTGSTIAYTGTGNATETFIGGTKTYNNITIAPGSGILTFSGAFTFANMTMSSAGTKTVKFTKSTTYTMTGTSFLSGTSGNLVTVDTNDGTGQWTLSKTSGTVICDYVAMTRSNATGGASFYLGANSTATGSTGWVIDSTAPTNPTSFDGYDTAAKAIPLTTDTFYNYANPYYEWNGATDADSGVAGYWVYFGTDDTANPVAVGTYQTAVNYTSAGSLSSGSSYYFRIRTQDNAANIASAETKFTYKYDSTLPNAPTFIAASPSGYTSTNSFSFSWPAATDNGSPQSGLAGYQYKRGNGTDSWSATQAARLVSGITSYQTGANVFLVRTIDVALNASATVQTNYYYSASAPTKPTSLDAIPDLDDVNSFSFTWTAPVHPIDITDYGYSINAYPTINNLTWTGTSATTLAAGSYATLQGTNTLYLVAKDESGSYALDSANVADVNFVCTTVAPPIPTSVTIIDSSNRAGSIWSLTTTWLAGPGQDPQTFDHYLIERSTNGTDFTSLATTLSTAYIDTVGLNNSTTYYYRIKSVDSAASTSEASSVVSDIPTGLYDTPPTLTGSPQVSAKAGSATIAWSNDRASSSFVRYGTSENDLSISKGQFDAVTSHSVNLSGLKPETRYFFQLQSADEFRSYSLDSAWSVTYNFVTLATPYISDVSVQNITLYSADISFKTSTVTSSTISFGTTLNYGSSATDLSSSSSTEHAVKLNNLSHSTGYHFKISGSDTDGNSLSSDDYTFQTRAMPKIFNLQSGIDYEDPRPGMKITWTTNVPTTSSIDYWPKDGSAVNEESRSQMVTSHEILITNLADNTEYRFYVYGRDELGNEVKSDTALLKSSDDTRPPKITDLMIETSNIGTGEGSSSQLIISWKSDELATSQVEYGEGSASPSYTNKTGEDATLKNSHMIIIGNLDTSKVYHLRAVSKDKAGNSGFSLDNAYITKKKTESIFDIIMRIFLKAFGWIDFLK